MNISGGRKRAKDAKVPAKKKRIPTITTASSEDEALPEIGAKVPVKPKKPKVIQEKEIRKPQKVNSFSLIHFKKKKIFDKLLFYKF